MKKTLLAIAVVAASSGAYAQVDNFYGEIGYGGMQYSESGLSATPGVGIVRLGMSINPNFSVEGLYAGTINNANVNVYGYPVSVKFNDIYGAYVKGKTEVAQNLELFAKAGITSAKLNASVVGHTFSTSGSDFSYGAGAQYNFTKAVYVEADYMSYYDKGGASVKGPSINLGFKF